LSHQPKLLLEAFYKQFLNKEFPSIALKKHSVDNIVWNGSQYVLGDKTETKSSKHISQAKSIAQLSWIAMIAQQLLNEGKTASLRDLYYMSLDPENISFDEQAESDNVILELETCLNSIRENFNIFPEERSDIFGELTIKYTSPKEYAGKTLDCTSHPDGITIGPRLAASEFVKCNAEHIICIEKGAVFNRFLEEKVWKTFNALLIHTSGQPPRATRRLIYRLNQEFKLPVYLLTDGDPWGLSIAITITYGSIKMAHVSEITVPTAKWLGIWATDMIDYKLPQIKFTDKDYSRCLTLKKDPRCQDKNIQTQLDTWMKLRGKCELEAFSRWGLAYITSKYLPEKLKQFEQFN